MTVLGSTHVAGWGNAFGTHVEAAVEREERQRGRGRGAGRERQARRGRDTQGGASGERLLGISNKEYVRWVSGAGASVEGGKGCTQPRYKHGA